MTSLFENILTSSERKRLSYVGIKRSLNPRKVFTKLEIKYYSMLQEMNIFYIPQYPMGGRYYDAYLPEQNVLLEFDGVFWHPEKESDCRYGFQKRSMWVDKLKNNMAREHGMKIVRIREDAPVTSEKLKELIWG